MACISLILFNILLLLHYNLATDNCVAPNTLSTSTIVELLGTSAYTKATDGRIEFASNINVTQTQTNCPTLDNANELTQLQLIERLTATCRYDRFKRPFVWINGKLSAKPVKVHVRLTLDVLQSSDASNPQLQADGILQLRYNDPRLAYEKIAPSRQLNILGNEALDKLIWTPRLYFTDEKHEIPLKTVEDNFLISIAPNGSVTLWTRISATLACTLNLKKFPFDDQLCQTIIESWMYNSSEVQLFWESENALTVAPKSGLMEFTLESFWFNDTTVDTNVVDVDFESETTNINKYTALKFSLFLTRQSGYYIMQYFLPSMMIVAISWVSFWLQADQTPARTTLGTTTMLSFITLGSSQEKNLPKVNYIKLSEIWFFACNAFIFCSLVEFAFVNTIWRRKHNVTLKRISSKHILKNTLTPRNNRQVSKRMRKVHSISSALSDTERFSYAGTNELQVDVGQFNRQDSSISSLSVDENPFQFKIDTTPNNGSLDNITIDVPKRKPISSMTPHEVSLWIDRKARFAFPLLFIIFNAIFWTIVNIG